MYLKLVRYESTLEPYFFEKTDTLDFLAFSTEKRLHTPPEHDCFHIIRPGEKWGGEDTVCWFAAEYRIPERLAGKDLFLRPNSGGYESLLWINGEPAGIFANKILADTHGNHYCDLLCPNACPGSTVSVMLESYAGRYVIGTQPLAEEKKGSFNYTYYPADICIKRQDIIDFVFDLHTLNQLYEMLDVNSFRRAQIIICLKKVFDTVMLSPEDCQEARWRGALAEAREIMRPVLEQKNPQSAPVAGLVGHSHMDTAWLWTTEETVKKCARTFSNQLQLMKQYPEYRFVQSSVYHLELMRLNYPGLFERISKQIREGRYEPNGAVWIECDCNITGGESLIRQFLWGQRYTQRYFGYISDCFWLPDTFGYSAALPQIMKGCSVRYFLTTKLSWNDSNRFPYETFIWKGIDGTEVLAHFNTIHCAPDPKALISQINGPGANYLHNKTASSHRLIAYGYGDGGGGPQFEHIEMARRTADLEGCPKARHTSVSAFMRELEAETEQNGNTPVYSGELYLELHRGTLTSQHEIKRRNRLAEQLLHELDWMTVARCLKENRISGAGDYSSLWETLLINQFHDILPGTCISEALDRSASDMQQLLDNGERIRRSILDGKDAALSVINSLGFPQGGVLDIPADAAGEYAGSGQRRTCLDGTERVFLSVGYIPPYSVLPLKEAVVSVPSGEAEFRSHGKYLETPFYHVHFNAAGGIDSLYFLPMKRELCRSGKSINTFLLAEDVPLMWDNWDIDADISGKWEAQTCLLSSEPVSVGKYAFCIRSRWKIGERSFLEQDMIFYAQTPRIDFETKLNWQERHRFLKVEIDTDIQTVLARQEIQFGHCQRATAVNTCTEQARFEVVQHKFTDLSEPGGGIALLNDCKYGVSVEGGCIRLSLQKGGTRPDPRADNGVHDFKYALLPHVGGFSAENVVYPAYKFNQPLYVLPSENGIKIPVSLGAPNVIIETIKPCEDENYAFILRCYECEGSYARIAVQSSLPIVKIEITDMLERSVREISLGQELAVHPFEIITMKLWYRAD